MSRRGEINAGEKAMAHRFAKGFRQNQQANKNDMRTPFASAPLTGDPVVFAPSQLNSARWQPDVNLWNQEKWRQIQQSNPQAEEKKISRMNPASDVTLVQDTNVEGFADVGTGNREDQHFDNIAWYKQVYSKIGGTAPHGMDLGKVYLDDKFFQWMEKKKDQEFYKNYQWYKLSLVDLSDPPVRDYWQKKFPELVEKKMLFYKNRMAVQARLQEIKIRGPDGMADLEFLYLFNLGMFDTSDVDEVNNYLMDPQDRKLWMAAINDGKIDWNNLSWNTDLQEPPSTPLDGISADNIFPLTVGGNQFNRWQLVPPRK